MESFDSEIGFEDPERGQKYNWIYKAITPEMSFAKIYPSGKQPLRRFRLEVIEVE